MATPESEPLRYSFPLSLSIWDQGTVEVPATPNHPMQGSAPSRLPLAWVLADDGTQCDLHAVESSVIPVTAFYLWLSYMAKPNLNK